MTWDSEIRFMVKFDLSGKNVKEGDYLKFTIPKEFTPRPLPNHFIASKKIGEETVNLADVYVKANPGNQGSEVKFVFRKNAEEHQNIKGWFFVKAVVTVQIEHEYEIIINTPDKEYKIKITVKPPNPPPLFRENI